MPSDFFVLIVIAAMAAFSIGLGFVSLTDRDPADRISPAE